MVHFLYFLHSSLAVTCVPAQGHVPGPRQSGERGPRRVQEGRMTKEAARVIMSLTEKPYDGETVRLKGTLSTRKSRSVIEKRQSAERARITLDESR